MPSSTFRLISHICSRIVACLEGWELEAKSMLDIGIGFGKYGFLAREYAGGFYLPEDEKKLLVVDGIEIYEPYIQPIHRLIYDNIYIGNASEIIKTLGIYDLILCIDMLEHTTLTEGFLLLEDIKKHSKKALIAIPRYPSPQKALFGNENEKHISKWKPDRLYPHGKVSYIEKRTLILEMRQEASDE